MYNYKTKNKRYIEDNFDLEEYKKLSYQARFREFREKNKKLLNVISGFIIFFAFVIAFLLYSLFDYYIALWRNDNIAKNAAVMIGSELDKDTVSYALPLPTLDLDSNQTLTIEPQVPTKTTVVRPIFIEMRETFANDDIVGYLKINDTKISYPVVQAKDNYFYLTRDVYKKSNVAGSIFMDDANTIDTFSQNTIIYGHNMKDQSMFHNVRLYQDQDFYNSHKYITLKTLYEDTKWEIFSFYSTTTDFNYIQTNFPDNDFLQQIKNKSVYETGVSVDFNDKILTLSTCTNADADTRYAIHARLIETTAPTTNELVQGQ